MTAESRFTVRVSELPSSKSLSDASGAAKHCGEQVPLDRAFVLIERYSANHAGRQSGHCSILDSFR
jgi:hypothetical protein